MNSLLEVYKTQVSSLNLDRDAMMLLAVFGRRKIVLTPILAKTPSRYSWTTNLKSDLAKELLGFTTNYIVLTNYINKLYFDTTLTIKTSLEKGNKMKPLVGHSIHT